VTDDLDLDRAREAFYATDKADAYIAALEAEVERLRQPFRIAQDYEFHCPRCGHEGTLSIDITHPDAEEGTPT